MTMFAVATAAIIAAMILLSKAKTPADNLSGLLEASAPRLR